MRAVRLCLALRGTNSTQGPWSLEFNEELLQVFRDLLETKCCSWKRLQSNLGPCRLNGTIKHTKCVIGFAAENFRSTKIPSAHIGVCKQLLLRHSPNSIRGVLPCVLPPL